MYPALLTESATFTGYIAEMLDAIRASVHGLTDEQARSRPCRSSLSLSGILKHCTWVMRIQLVPRSTEPGSADGAAEFMGSFVPTDSESLTDLLDAFDTTRRQYLQVLADLDPAAEMTVGPRPWEDQHESEQATTRMLLAHHIDEFARHAGHADIIREQIDGADAMSLRFAVEGRAGNQYVQPWTPSE